MANSRTVIFEKKYKANMNDFHSIEDVDKFIEGKIGRKMKVTKTDSNIVDNTGNVFKIKQYDINGLIDKALNIKKSH